MTEYTLSGESSIAAVITGAELLGVTQAGVYKFAKLSDVLAYVGSGTSIGGPVTYTGTATFQNGVVFAGPVAVVASGQSAPIGTTLSAKVGFFGVAGTSQRTSGAQVTMTFSVFTAIGSSTVGFNSTAQASLLFGQVQEMQQTLLDLGVWKGS